MKQAVFSLYTGSDIKDRNKIHCDAKQRKNNFYQPQNKCSNGSMNKPFPSQMSKYRSYKGEDQTGNRQEEHADQRYGHEQRIYRSSVRRSLKKTGRDETKHGNDKNYQRYRCQNLCSSVSFFSFPFITYFLTALTIEAVPDIIYS